MGNHNADGPDAKTSVKLFLLAALIVGIIVAAALMF